MATNKINKEFLTETKAAPSVSINANAFSSFSIDVSKSGYIPIGVLELVKSGGSSGYCVISNFYFNTSKTTLKVDVVNTYTGTATVNLTATILYRKS